MSNVLSNKKNIILLAFAALCAVVSLMTMQPEQVRAATYFGGMRTAMLSCTCSGNTVIYVNNYATGSQLALIYDGSGRIFANNNIFGTYLLGSYTTGGSCRVGVEPYCESVNVDGRFDSNPGTGTS